MASFERKEEDAFEKRAQMYDGWTLLLIWRENSVGGLNGTGQREETAVVVAQLAASMWAPIYPIVGDMTKMT